MLEFSQTDTFLKKEKPVCSTSFLEFPKRPNRIIYFQVEVPTFTKTVSSVKQNLPWEFEENQYSKSTQAKKKKLVRNLV